MNHVKTLNSLALAITLSLSTSAALAENNEVQDMSDPLAVYTQAGFGATDKGLNLKFGQTYDTGNDDTMAMNVFEVKGIAGDIFGWAGSSERDDSIDSVRFRNFNVDHTNGRGSQVDMNYDVERESLDISYSFIQALPQWGGLNVYPLAGVGVNLTNGEMDTGNGVEKIGYTIPGTFGVVGAYTKYSITDNLWINYNPMWLTTISGADAYVNNAYGAGNSSVFANELAVSYQINPRTNVRYFANWTQYQSFSDGDQRIEINYQF